MIAINASSRYYLKTIPTCDEFRPNFKIQSHPIMTNESVDFQTESCHLAGVSKSRIVECLNIDEYKIRIKEHQDYEVSKFKFLLQISFALELGLKNLILNGYKEPIMHLTENSSIVSEHSDDESYHESNDTLDINVTTGADTEMSNRIAENMSFEIVGNRLEIDLTGISNLPEDTDDDSDDDITFNEMFVNASKHIPQVLNSFKNTNRLDVGLDSAYVSEMLCERDPELELKTFVDLVVNKFDIEHFTEIPIPEESHEHVELPEHFEEFIALDDETIEMATPFLKACYKVLIERMTMFDTAIKTSNTFWEKHAYEHAEQTLDMCKKVEQECPVCLEDTSCLVSACGHRICNGCWMSKRNGTCSTCKRQVVSIFGPTLFQKHNLFLQKIKSILAKAKKDTLFLYKDEAFLSFFKRTKLITTDAYIEGCKFFAVSNEFVCIPEKNRCHFNVSKQNCIFC